MPPSRNVRIVNLGCAKNEVDSEEIAGVLAQEGYTIDGATKAPDITVINTCGFLESSKAESIEAIKKAVRTKGNGKIIVAGCLAQRLGDELLRLAPGADAYVGVGQMGRFADIVARTLASSEPRIEIEPPHHRWADVATRTRSGHPWSAYLKVSEGCDHRCTFCTIPSFRGGHQSKPIERVLEEANHLVASGAKEINLIAQDVTQYGYDLYRAFTLPKLLRELNKVSGLSWIRILYFYPNRLTPEVRQAMAECDKVLPYIDIPLQHSHPDVLRRMKRPWDGDRYLQLLDQLRESLPQAAIRTTFILGFPGETEQEFAHLLNFTMRARLDRVGAFLFSREPGTPSYEMPNQVPTKIKKERYDRLMRTQLRISRELNEAWVGRQLDVLVESTEDGWSVGRSYRDAPEIDGQVLIHAPIEPGTIQKVTITEAGDYDLISDPLGKRTRQLKPIRQNPRPPL